MKNITSFNDIIPNYDTFILDQWGVIHNGGDAFPEAIKTLEALKSANKKVIILSNSGKLRSTSYQRLADSGISRDLYINVMTSGDHMRNAFESGRFDNLGKKPKLFTWDDDHSILDDLTMTDTNTNDANFILCCGFDRDGIDEYLDDLKIAKQRGLELIVSNPDLFALSPQGKLKECPGLIAKTYADMGGTVHWFGKPQAEMYKLCQDIVGGWNNAVAVGDSLEHDIAGANNFNISSVLITSGIHAKDLKTNTVSEISKEHNVSPTYVIDWFKV